MRAGPSAFGQERLILIRLGEQGKLGHPEKMGIVRQLEGTLHQSKPCILRLPEPTFRCEDFGNSHPQTTQLCPSAFGDLLSLSQPDDIANFGATTCYRSVA